jgi:hypothetical protein
MSKFFSTQNLVILIILASITVAIGALLKIESKREYSSIVLSIGLIISSIAIVGVVLKYFNKDN